MAHAISKYEADRGLKQQEAESNVADDVLSKIEQSNVASSGGRRVARLEERCHSADILLRLCERDARLQSRHGLEISHVAVRRLRRKVEGRRRYFPLRQHPDVRAGRPLGPRWQHADEGVHLAVDPEWLPDGVCLLAVQLLPRATTENNPTVAWRRVLGPGKATSDRGRHPEHVEELGGHEGADELRRFAGSCRHGEGQRAVSRDSLQRLLLPAQVDELSGRMIAARFVGGRRGDADDAVGLVEGQRAQEHAIDHAEDGRVRADAERERDDGDQREARVLEEGANRVPEIVQHALTTFCGHSVRSATIGSTFIARRAGTYDAMMAERMSRTVDAAIARRSVGRTPKIIPESA